MKCSIVVPVWNPGPSLNRCVNSLLSQGMAEGDYEIVLVDDGSTDGTATRLDLLAAAHPGRVRVVHTPPSGWPGRPRNIGTKIARGTYVHYVDNDDILPPYALQALYDAAERTGADIVMGRPASDFRGINHAVYRQNLDGVTLRDAPDLVETTTAHKMFRREFLIRHGIRFPEALPHEDQLFVLRAYIHATAITLLNDRCYYFYLRRLGSGRNAGDRSIDPDAHFDAVEQVIDILDSEVPDAELRDRIAQRFYRVELLNLLWSQGMLTATPEVQQHLFAQIRRISGTRFSESTRGAVGVVHRTLGALVEAGDLAGALAFAKDCRRIGLRLSARDMRWHAGLLDVTLDATLTLGGEPLRCESLAGGWALPAELTASSSIPDRTFDPNRDCPDAELMLVSRVDDVTFGLGPGLRVEIDDEGIVRVTGTVAIDPRTALAGGPIADGVWDFRLRLWLGGISRTPTVPLDESESEPLAPMVTTGRQVIRPFHHDADHQLALDAGQWLSSLPSTLAASSELASIGSNWLRLSVPAQCRVGLTAELLLSPLDRKRGRGFTLPGTLMGWPTGAAHMVARLPSDLPDGNWRAWLRLAGPAASAPTALPWSVHRSAGTAEVRPHPPAPAT